MSKSKFISTFLFVFFCAGLLSCTKEEDIEPITTIYSNVTWQSDANQQFKTVELTVPSITQEIVDRGAVLVYGSNDGQLWDVLPKSVNTSSLWYEYKLNYVRVLYFSANEIFDPNSQYKNLKVVAIAGQ